jgi:hypothetical protein
MFFANDQRQMTNGQRLVASLRVHPGLQYQDCSHLIYHLAAALDRHVGFP